MLSISRLEIISEAKTLSVDSVSLIPRLAYHARMLACRNRYDLLFLDNRAEYM